MQKPVSDFINACSVFIHQHMLRVFTLLNFIIAIWLIVFLGYNTYAEIGRNENMVTDFMAFYAAAVTLGHHTSDMYNTLAYQNLYLNINNLSVPKGGIYFPFLCPPFFAFFLYPLGFFSLKAAFGMFFFINLLLLWLVTLQIRIYLASSSVTNSTLFIQSVFLCFSPVFVVFFKGQISLIILALLMGFMLNMRANRLWTATILLAVLINIKPQYFIILWLALAGQRQWKYFILTGIFCTIIIGICTCIYGLNIWEKYFHILTFQYQQYFPLVNMKGLLQSVFGYTNQFNYVTILFYIFVLIFAMSGMFFKHMRSVYTLPHILALTLFFSPYILTHDMVLYLPVGLSIITVLHKSKKSYLLIPCYIMAIVLPLMGLWFGGYWSLIWGSIFNYQCLGLLLTILSRVPTIKKA